MNTHLTPTHQRGAVLVVGLVLLIVISLMGLVGYSVATQQERMSGNTRDKLRSFEAAEASLRDCEAQVEQNALTGGWYYTTANNAGEVPRYLGSLWDEDTAGATRWLGAVPGTVREPRCIVEQLGTIYSAERARDDDLTNTPVSTPEMVYRVTARGYGTRVETNSTVQSTLRRAL